MIRRSAPVLLLALAGALAAAGCGSPCEDLASRICDCQPTDALQQSCKQGVDDNGHAGDASSEEQDRCAELLDTCSCEALACGDLAACGLANDSGLAGSAGAPAGTCE